MLHGSLVVEYRPVGPFAMNSYVIGCTQSKQGAVVDSGGETDKILALAANHELEIVKLLQTHGHLDHVAGLNQMKAATNAPIYLHSNDEPIYSNAATAGRMFGINVDNPPPYDEALEDGDVIELGELRLRVLSTPGHCPGLVCFHDETNGVAFVGDLIFRGSIGRVDLPGADPRAMVASLRRLMDELADATVVYPGHMQPTTMGTEKKTNPYLLQIAAGATAI